MWVVIFASLFLVSGCETTSQGNGVATSSAPPQPRAQVTVPTAFFLFFEADAITLAPSELVLLQEIVSISNAFDNVKFNIVGHRAASESGSVRGAPIDQARAMVVARVLAENGVPRERITAAASGVRESVAEAAGGDPAADRRVDIILRVEGASDLVATPDEPAPSGAAS